MKWLKQHLFLFIWLFSIPQPQYVSAAEALSSFPQETQLFFECALKSLPESQSQLLLQELHRLSLHISSLPSPLMKPFLKSEFIKYLFSYPLPVGNRDGLFINQESLKLLQEKYGRERDQLCPFYWWLIEGLQMDLWDLSEQRLFYQKEKKVVNRTSKKIELSQDWVMILLKKPVHSLHQLIGKMAITYADQLKSQITVFSSLIPSQKKPIPKHLIPRPTPTAAVVAAPLTPTVAPLDPLPPVPEPPASNPTPNPTPKDELTEDQKKNEVFLDKALAGLTITSVSTPSQTATESVNQNEKTVIEENIPRKAPAPQRSRGWTPRDDQDFYFLDE
jgi:hypothetical protein